MPLGKIRGQIRAAVTAGGILYSKHVRDRMAERQVSRLDIEQVLRTGAVRRDGRGKVGSKYVVTGKDLDDRRHKVVVEKDSGGEFTILTVHEVADKERK